MNVNNPSASFVAATSFYNTKVASGAYTSTTIVAAASNTKGIYILSASFFIYDASYAFCLNTIGPLFVAAGKDLIWNQNATSIIGPSGTQAQTLLSGTDVIGGCGDAISGLTSPTHHELVMSYRIL